MISVILASGASLKDCDIEKIRIAKESEKINFVISVSDVGILKSPWADALVSHDTAWWVAHPEAKQFKGRKFSSRGYGDYVEKVELSHYGYKTGINSGLLGMIVAQKLFNSNKVILLGFDMHRRNGQHFFGEHTAIFNNAPLRNTDEDMFKRHIKQFDQFSGCEVINCTEGSDLKRFPFSKLDDII